MLLNELIGYKKFKDQSRLDVAKFAEEHGEWKRLGKGTYSQALEYKGKVYKFWWADSAYEKFVDFCKKHSDSPYLPKIYSEIKTIPAGFLKRHETAPDKIKYVKIEKLDSFRGKTVAKIPFYDEIDTGREYITIHFEVLVNTVVRAVVDNHTIPNTVDAMREHLTRLWVGTDEQHNELLWPDSKKIMELLKFLVELNKLGLANDLSNDLHEDNLALRGDQPVIIDPFADQKDLQQARQWRDFEDTMIASQRA